MKKPQLILLPSLLLPFLAGGIGSYFTAPAIDTWYSTLEKPFFNPPNFVFGPVWSVLYLMMGISLYLVWSKKTKSKVRSRGLQFFLAQLVLNTLWSVVFFGLKSPLLGLIVIVALLVMIIFTVKYFLKVSRNAGLLLLPYLAWVCFATLLNLFIFLLNK